MLNFLKLSSNISSASKTLKKQLFYKVGYCPFFQIILVSQNAHIAFPQSSQISPHPKGGTFPPDKKPLWKPWHGRPHLPAMVQPAYQQCKLFRQAVWPLTGRLQVSLMNCVQNASKNIVDKKILYAILPDLASWLAESALFYDMLKGEVHSKRKG